MKKLKKQKAKLPMDQVIFDLEKARNSKVLVYITGDRKVANGPGDALATGVALDVLPLFKNILTSIKKTKKITLVLYTNGGHLNTPWPLVNLIREYCEIFEVVVLERALSAGTLISLGADKIVMSPYSFLSPIDPAANIQNENSQKKKFEIEDIIGYIDFVKEKIGITEQQALCEIMKDLTKEIAPTMLGSFNRTHSLVRRIAKELLSLHKEPVTERQSKEIIENLVQKLFSHDHLISRREARCIGFDTLIEYSDEKTEKVLTNLFKNYSKLLELDNDFNPVVEVGKAEKKEIDLIRAVIHSEKIKYNFKTKCLAQKIVDPAGNNQFAINFSEQKWTKI